MPKRKQPERDLKTSLKLLGLGVLIAAAVFVLSNWGYFWENIKFEFHRPKPAPVAAVQPAAKVTPNTLSIPSLGITAPVQFATQANETSFQAALLNGVVHYPGTAMVGQVGNDYIFGHSSDYIWSKGHFKTIFALLPKIQVGAAVLLSDAEGNQYTYKVAAVRIVSPTDTSVLSQATGGQKVLTVQTSYPVGTALQRFVAICDLVQ